MTSTQNSKKAMSAPGFWETLRELLTGSRRPLNCLQVEVSTRCPGRCGYCPHTLMAERWRTEDMNLDTYGRLWPLMRRSDRVHLQGWGEPLLHDDFFEMAALARKAGCAVSTTTCGLRMTAAMAERLVKSGLDIVAFSLTGTDKRSNALRCGIDFERVCAAIAQLQAVRRARQGVHMEIHIAYLLLASRMDSVRGLPALMQRLGVHAAVISSLDYLPVIDLAPEAFGLHETEKLERGNKILQETASEAQRLGLGFHWALPSAEASGDQCRENPERSMFVSVDGSLSPCVYTNLPFADPDPMRRVFGNVREQDPLMIWESDAFRRFRDGLICGRPDERCQPCIKRFEGY